MNIGDALAPFARLFRERGADLDPLFRGYRQSRKLPPDDPRRLAWDDYWRWMDDQGFGGMLRQIDAGAKPPATGARGKRGPGAGRSAARDLEAVAALMADGMTFATACHSLGFGKSRRDYLRRLSKSGKK